MFHKQNYFKKTYQHKTVVCLFHLVLTGKRDFFYIA